MAAHEQRLMPRRAGGGTRCRVPPPDPFFPEDRGWFWCPACGDWNQFILPGPEPSELVLQTGRVPARAGGRGNPMHSIRPFRTVFQRPQETVETVETEETAETEETVSRTDRYLPKEHMPDRSLGLSDGESCPFPLARSVSWYTTYHIQRDLIVNY